MQKSHLIESLTPLIGRQVDEALVKEIVEIVTNGAVYFSLEVVRPNDGSLSFLRNVGNYDVLTKLRFLKVEIISATWRGEEEHVLSGEALSNKLAISNTGTMTRYTVPPFPGVSKEQSHKFYGMLFSLSETSFHSGFMRVDDFIQPDEIKLRISGYSFSK